MYRPYSTASALAKYLQIVNTREGNLKSLTRATADQSNCGQVVDMTRRQGFAGHHLNPTEQTGNIIVELTN